MKEQIFADWDAVPLILNIREAARLLRVSPGYIKKKCVSGELPAVKLSAGWRINKNDLAELLKQHKTG